MSFALIRITIRDSGTWALVYWRIYASLGLNELTNQTYHIKSQQNGRHFANNICKFIYLNENFVLLIDISLKLISKGQTDNKSSLVQVMFLSRSLTQKIIKIYVYGIFRSGVNKFYTKQNIYSYQYRILQVPCSFINWKCKSSIATKMTTYLKLP